MQSRLERRRGKKKKEEKGKTAARMGPVWKGPRERSCAR